MPVKATRQGVTQALQRLGYALLLPVSILPMTALIYRLGQPDVLDLAVLSLTGQAIFSQMSLIYAVAIAFSLSRQELERVTLSMPSKPIAVEHPRLASVAPSDAGDPVPQGAGRDG